MSLAATTSPRAHVHLPGFTFVGHREMWFGTDKVSADIYQRAGGITAELRNMERQQRAANPEAVESWSVLHWKDHGRTMVAVRVRS